MRTQTLLVATLVALGMSAAAVAASSNKIPIANEASPSLKWTPVAESIVKPDYPQAYASANPQVCLTVGYLINEDGHTSDFALLKSWSSAGNGRSSDQLWGAFAGSASQALAQWQFAPKEQGGAATPMYTATTFVFGPGDSAATKARCAIADLTTRLLELRYDQRAGRLMQGGVFSRLDIDHDLAERFRQNANMMREQDNASTMSRQISSQRQENQGQSAPPAPK